MSENTQSDKVHSLFVSFQDLQAEVRKLQNEAESKRQRKLSKERDLSFAESKTRDSDNELNMERLNLSKLQDYNKALKQQAEKERVEQYAVYLELLQVEESIKSLEQQKYNNKVKYTQELREMARIQYQKREAFKATLNIPSKFQQLPPTPATVSVVLPVSTMSVAAVQPAAVAVVEEFMDVETESPSAAAPVQVTPVADVAASGATMATDDTDKTASGVDIDVTVAIDVVQQQQQQQQQQQ